MSTPVRLLLVAPAEAAFDAGDGLALTRAGSAVAARAYLAGTPFDAVAVADAGMAADLAALARALGLDTPVVPFGDAADLAAWLRRTFGARMEPPAAAREPAGADALRRLRADLARAAHDIGGPLAVISGNAQLGRELARAFEADPQLVEAFEQIEEGAAEMAARLRLLSGLRAHLDALLGEGPERA